MPLFQRSSNFDINGGNFHDNTKQIIINNNSSGTVLVENMGTTNIYVGGTHRDHSAYRQDDAHCHLGLPTQQLSTDASDYTGYASAETPGVSQPVYSQPDDPPIATKGVLRDHSKEPEAYFEWQLPALHLLSNLVGINEEALKMIPLASALGAPDSALLPRDTRGQEDTLDVSTSAHRGKERGGNRLICPAENHSLIPNRAGGE